MDITLLAFAVIMTLLIIAMILLIVLIIRQMSDTRAEKRRIQRRQARVRAVSQNGARGQAGNNGAGAQQPYVPAPPTRIAPFEYRIRLQDLQTGNVYALNLHEPVVLCRNDNVSDPFRRDSLLPLTASEAGCRLFQSRGSVYIQPVGTSAKAAVNGVTVTETSELQKGDVLNLGEVSLGVSLIRPESTNITQIRDFSNHGKNVM